MDCGSGSKTIARVDISASRDLAAAAIRRQDSDLPPYRARRVGEFRHDARPWFGGAVVETLLMLGSHLSRPSRLDPTTDRSDRIEGQYRGAVRLSTPAGFTPQRGGPGRLNQAFHANRWVPDGPWARDATPSRLDLRDPNWSVIWTD
jgi:hypothetical protein